MMRRPLDFDLGELNQNCSTHLFQNFHKAGIAPIWVDSKGGPKGGAVFACYDGLGTCFRLLPRAPKFFHASLRGNLLSHSDATTLSHKLIRTVRNIRERYSGYFSPELRGGTVGRILQNSAEPMDYDFLEVHTNLVPDELYAALPWPLIPEAHFPVGVLASAGVRDQYYKQAVQEPMRALNIAVDVATLAACMELSVSETIAVLDWLDGKVTQRHTEPLTVRSGHEFRKIMLPCLSGGFQGLVFAFFYNLPERLEGFVLSQLQHFAATIGEGVAAFRERRFVQARDNASNLTDYLSALVAISPPLEHIVCEAGNERIGLRLQREGPYLAGYRVLQGQALTEVCEDRGNDLLIGHDNPGVRVLIKLPTDIPALDPQFTLLRLKPVVSLAPYAIQQSARVLTRTELGALRHQLRGQVHQERGGQAAARRLFAVDQILRNYEQGEVVLSNAKARAYIGEILGKESSGYQITGKASAKFIADIEKMLPNSLSFEAISAYSIRVRWNPENNSPLRSEEFQPTDG